MPDTAVRIRILRVPVIAGVFVAVAAAFQDTRLAAFAIWGLGSVAVFGIVAERRIRRWRRFRDARTFRAMAEGVALFITSLASALAVAFLLFGPQGTQYGRPLIAVALGCFLAAGVVMHDEDPVA